MSYWAQPFTARVRGCVFSLDQRTNVLACICFRCVHGNAIDVTNETLTQQERLDADQAPHIGGHVPTDLRIGERLMQRRDC
jgi:hypothetical protein